MSKTIQQLSVQAAQIEEATRQGENTALRVGGLFTDIVDYLETLHLNDVTLGPLLTALNNSNLLNPQDGSILAFSMMKDGWTFSDAVAQLKITTNGIEQLVASNYEAVTRILGEFQNTIDEVDRRVRQYKSDYDEDQINYGTWKNQTETAISQFAAAFTVDGRIVSMSQMVQTAYDISTQVTNNKDAADSAFAKLFDLAGMELTDDKTASWLYQNRAGIYGASATFDTQGNIKAQSKLGVTVNSIQSEVSNATGQVSLISQTVEEISARVTTIDGRTADMSVYVTKDGNSYITNARIRADNIEMTGNQFRGWFSDYIDLTADMIQFNFTKQTDFTSGGHTVMRIEADGDLLIAGTLTSNANIDGIRTSDSGEIQRYNPTDGWIPLYASRYVRTIFSATTLRSEDDFVILSGNTTYNVTLPASPKDGKVITFKNLGTQRWIVAPTGYSIVVYDQTPVSSKDLNGFHRAELVHYNHVWYWNYMET